MIVTFGVFMPELPITAVDRLIRKKHEDLRVKMEAVEVLREILEAYSLEIVDNAVDLMKNAKRKTITGEDIKLGSKLFKD